ncbi:hypothetical protein LK542_12980 [Massilia sp. IC2-477]|uniref:hypothetical protein n=1 Tax=Massilia sp. IC2-477 TaxID=2887198 RepID=UPI001D0FE479|nr:hypothetical protein [Massilia sp. IC2-477]MCC2956528.1 hypothetical protein [Massilia sp. IC2-477]
MNSKNLLLLGAVCLGCTAAAAESDSVGNKKLPAGAVLMCRQHVHGASDKPMHIDWQAFGLNEDRERIKHFYQAQFGQPPTREDAQSYTWIFEGKQNELHYSVRTPSANGPWAACSIQATNFEVIVLISNASWPKGR